MITLRRPVIKRWPFKDEADAGELVITLLGDAPELHQLGEEIDRLCAKPVTHENFTRAVLGILPEFAQVSTTWRTGPWLVEVSEGALLREPVHAEGT